MLFLFVERNQLEKYFNFIETHAVYHIKNIVFDVSYVLFTFYFVFFFAFSLDHTSNIAYINSSTHSISPHAISRLISIALVSISLFSLIACCFFASSNCARTAASSFSRVSHWVL